MKVAHHAVLVIGLLLVLQPTLNSNGRSGAGVNALQRWDAEDGDESWYSSFGGIRNRMKKAAEGVKDYYDEHARDTVATYTNQAAEIAKQAAATAKQAGNGAKDYYDENLKNKAGEFASAAAEAADGVAGAAKDCLSAGAEKAKEYGAAAAEVAKDAASVTAEKAKVYGKKAASAAKGAASATADAAEKAAATAKKAASATASAAKHAASATASAAKEAASATADAATVAAKQAAATAKNAASATADAAKVAAEKAAAAAKDAANVLGDQIKLHQETYKTFDLESFKKQAMQSMETLRREFSAGTDSSADGHADSGTKDSSSSSSSSGGGGGSTSEANANSNANPAGGAQNTGQKDGPPISEGGKRCPYQTRRKLESEFAELAVQVLKAKTCTSLTDMTKNMYADLLSSGAASCDGIYVLLDEFNGKLPSRKVRLCHENADGGANPDAEPPQQLN